MLILNNTNEVKTHTLVKYKTIVLSYNFLTIHGLPFCSFYSNELLKKFNTLVLALEVKKDAATAILAIIENFPHLIINSNLYKDLNIIKINAMSNTNLFTSLKEFKEYISC